MTPSRKGASSFATDRTDKDPEDVPNAERPKSRPPSNLREKFPLFSRALPKYTGPYTVRCSEYLMLLSADDLATGWDDGD